MSVRLQTDTIRNGRRSWLHPKTEKRSRRCLQQLIYVFILIYYLSKHPSVRMSPCFVFVDYLQTRIGDFVEPLVSAWTHCEDKTTKIHCCSPRNNQSHNSNLSCLHFGFLWITHKKKKKHFCLFLFFPALPNFGTDLPQVSNRGWKQQHDTDMQMLKYNFSYIVESLIPVRAVGALTEHGQVKIGTVVWCRCSFSWCAAVCFDLFM